MQGSYPFVDGYPGMRSFLAAPRLLHCRAFGPWFPSKCVRGAFIACVGSSVWLMSFRWWFSFLSPAPVSDPVSRRREKRAQAMNWKTCCSLSVGFFFSSAPFAFAPFAPPASQKLEFLAVLPLYEILLPRIKRVVCVQRTPPVQHVACGRIPRSLHCD